MTRVVRVALDVPLSHAFDYRLEEACTEDIGCLTIVPFGRSVAWAVTMRVESKPRTEHQVTVY